MARYINDKTKRRPQDKLTEERYEYLTVDQAEPNLGDPVFPGDTPPFGTQYITVSIEGYPGERYWIPNQGGIIPGSITIYDENVIVGGISSTTQLNFIGAAVSASSNLTFKETTLTLRDSETFSFNVGLAVTQLNSDASGVVKYSTTNAGIVTITNVTGSFTTNAADELYQDNVGIAKTPLSATSVINASVASNIEISPEYFSSDKQLIFNNNDEFDGAVGFIYQNNGATESNVGLASVGIGTTLARRTLHIDGDIKLTGSIEDYNNSLGNTSDILVKNSSGGIEWIEQNSLNVGAAGTYYEVQFHSGTGTLAGADKLVYRSDLNGGQIGIGTTNPSKLLDVEGDSIFVGDVTFDGQTTDYDALWDRSENAFIVKDNAKFAAGTDSDLEIYHNGTTGYIDNKTGTFYIRNHVDNDDNGDIHIQAKKDQSSIICYDDSGVYLYHNGSTRAYTDSSGFRIDGRLYVDHGTSEFHGDVRFDGSTADRDIYFDEGENSLIAYDNAQFRVGTGGDVRIYHDGSNTYIEPKSDGVGDLIVGSATTDIAKFVYDGGVSLYYQDVLKFDTIGAGVTVYGTAILPQINTVGVATFDNVRIGYDNDGTIDTSSGNLILDSNAGTVQVDDILFVNSTAQSDNKDSGSIYTQGGVGVEKNLNVGGSVGIASTAESTSKDTGALIVEGGVGIEKNLNVGGSVKVTGIATITEKFYIGSGNTGITTILDEDDMVSDSDTALATQQSIKKYVDDQITAEDLDFSGDTGTGQVDLDSQVLAIEGTTNEIKTSASGQTLTIGFDDNVTIDYLTSTNIKATGITTLGVTTLTDVTIQQLDVSGITTLGVTTLTDTTSQQLFVSGISTLGNVFIQPIGTGASVGEKEPGVSGVVTFYGDGSGLRNVVAIGTGIDIKNSGTPVGSANTINFGDNLTGNLDAGVYTVNAADAPEVDVYWIKNNLGIHTLGNVGIGLTNPSRKLDVIGDAKFKNSEINFNDFCIIGAGTQEWYIPNDYERQLSPQVGTAITSGALGANPTRTTDEEIYDHIWDNYDDFDLDGDGIVSYVDVSMLLRYKSGVTNLPSAYNSVWSDFATRNTDSEIRSFIQSNLSTYDVTGNGSFDLYSDVIIILRVFGATQAPSGGTTPEIYEEFDFSNDSFLDPDDGGGAQFRINRTVGIGTTTLSNTETRVLDVYGKVSIADTTSNAGGARYISTEAPTAAVGKDGDIWYDISSTGNVFGTGGNIPVGGIIMWYGTIENIPASWALCDGTSYNTAIGTIVTPDLRDRFVVGAATTVTVNSNDYPGTTITGAGTTTGGSKDAVLVSHSHTYDVASYNEDTSPVTAAQTADRATNTSTYSTSTEGTGGTNANLPPYYALAYIMRVS